MRILKWCILVVLVLVAALVGYRMMTIDSVNARVAEEIRQNPEGTRAAKTMLLTLEDGRMYPVNYLHEGQMVFMGIDGRWWREFVGDGQSVTMFIKGRQYRGHAVAVLDDPAYTDDVFSRLRPTAPEWLPRWANGKLVVITLSK